MRLIDAETLMADCQLAQKQADRHGREFANAFYSGGGEISTEWWCVEDMIENAPTIKPERKVGEWIYEVQDRLEDETDDGRVYRKEKRWKCSECGYDKGFVLYKPKDKFCVECGADMRGDLT